jgi:hypothetical protein
MPRSCTICTHEEREAIDNALVSRRPFREITELYGTSKAALSRHLNDHILPHVSRIRASEDQDRAARMVKRIDTLTRETREVLEMSKTGEDRDLDRVLKAVTRLERQLELEAKIEKVISDSPSITILNSPQWHILIEESYIALEPFPEAREALARTLLELENSGRLEALGSSGGPVGEDPWG